VPHGWEAQVLFEETTRTLLCGDLFTHVGRTSAVTTESIVDLAMAAEDVFGATGIGPHTGPTLRRLAKLAPSALAVMHGASFRGNAGAQLIELARMYEQRLARAHAG
jgi:hypothetical protein